MSSSDGPDIPSDVEQCDALADLPAGDTQFDIALRRLCHEAGSVDPQSVVARFSSAF